MIQRLAFILLVLLSVLKTGTAMSDIPEKDLLKSIGEGHTDVLIQSLGEGVEIDGLYENGKTTLLNFAIRAGNINAVKILIDHGANLDLESRGKTPLINAVTKRDLMLLHLLIKNGADLDATVKKGNTALIYAVKSGKMDFVRMLVENGADVEYENENGLTALDFANMANYPEIAKYLVKIIEMRNYYTSLPDYTDGPHIEWLDDTTARMFYMIYDTTVNYPLIREDYFTVKSDSLIVKGFTNDNASYTIVKNFKEDSSEFRNVSKVLAIGDIHGHFSAMVQYLKTNAVVDDKLNWIWGDGHVVFLGDVFDRGNEVTESLWFIYELDLKARKHGGRVHMLLGNHEVMVMRNDTRYLNRKYELFSNYFTRDYADFYGQHSVLGSWLRSRDAVIKINDILFSHAGISPTMLNRKVSIEKINSVLHEYLSNDVEAPMEDAELANLIFNEDGPLWYRGYVLEGFGGRNAITEKNVSAVLKFYKAQRLIIAHTEVNKMTALFNGKVIAIDVPIRTETIIPEALLIDNGQFFRLTNAAEKIPCAYEIAEDTP